MRARFDLQNERGFLSNGRFHNVPTLSQSAKNANHRLARMLAPSNAAIFDGGRLAKLNRLKHLSGSKPIIVVGVVQIVAIHRIEAREQDVPVAGGVHAFF